MKSKILSSYFFSSPSEVISEFDLVGREGEKGCYHSETKRALVFLFPHTQIEDLISTVNHEIYHHAIELDEDLSIDEDQEEKLIDKLTWTLEGVLI
tara:strand:- start:46 stop:333 length:288 start_codon:yes stop_codon:yes gene_type:complete